MSKPSKILFIVLLLLALIYVLTAQTQQAPADLVLTNGKIITVDARDSIAQAVAITQGKIVAVGSNDQIRTRTGAQTQVIDLRGRTMTPGLIDSHAHFQEVDALFTIDLSDLSIKNMDDV